MKNVIALLAILFAFNMAAQDKNKQTFFEYSKSLIVDSNITPSEVKKMKSKDFEEDARTITVYPVEKLVAFDLTFVVKSVPISDETFSLIDKTWKIRLRDEDFAFLFIGENYAIISLESDNRNLILINENFKFK